MLDLSPWPGLTLGNRLGGGHRNAVYEVDGPARLIARRSLRTSDALAWELDLLDFLASYDFIVPATVPTVDGRRSVDGILVQTWVDGHPPEGDDWTIVARELVRLHRLTAGWSTQRPGFSSTQDLLTELYGGDVNLHVMPADAVRLCRQAWGGLPDVPLSVIHGDPGGANIRIQGGRVGFIDWDESRIDHPDLDLVEIPDGPLTSHRLTMALAAIDAWETACGWAIEPAYARQRLDSLRQRVGN